MRPLGLILLALLTFGCSAPPPPEEAVATTPLGTPEPEVRVLDAGAAPRTRLRELPAEAGRETRELVLVMTGEQVQGGMTGLLNSPPVGLTLTLSRQAASDTGVAVSFEGSPFTVSDGELVDANVLLAMQAALDGTTGFAGSASVDRSHALNELVLDHPDADNRQAQQLAAAFAQTLAQLALRFPAEPVGVGARWSWRSEHRNSVGVLFAQRNTATLLESEGGRLLITLHAGSEAERQVLRGPPMPEDTVLDIVHAESAAQVELRFEAAGLLPVHATVHATWALDFISDRAGVADAISLLQEMSLELARPD